jgi:tetratricopeptide (TPR) repeat protein
MIVVYLLLMACQVANLADQNPFCQAWNLIVPWFGALIARYVFLRVDAAVNGLLNNHRVLKTSMSRQVTLAAITKALGEYKYHSVGFQITNEDEGSGQLSGKWNIRIDWLKFLLFLTPWEMSLYSQSIDVTVDVEVTSLSAEETEVDIRFTNEADPASIDWPGYIVRLQVLTLVQNAIECQRTVTLTDPRKEFSRYDQVTGLLHEGRSHYNKGKFKRALKWFKNASLLKPDRADAWRWVAKTLESLERGDEAIAAYEKALALDPRIEVLWLDYASLLANQGKSDEAAEAFRKAFATGLEQVPAGEFLPAVLQEHLPKAGHAEETRRDLPASLYSFVGA